MGDEYAVDSSAAGFQQNDSALDSQNGFSGSQNYDQGNTGSSEDEDSRKLFIGGIAPSATKDDVQNYFSQYGEVQMCTIKTDVYTGRSRGFGFLIFKDASAVEAVLKIGGHEIQGKRVDPKLATPQSNKQQQEQPEEKSAKVFVGGLDKSITKEEIQEAFGQRGSVVDVYLPTDKMSGETKGFAFVTFDENAVAEALCNEGKMIVSGKECDVRKATHKSESRNSFGGRGGRGGRGGFRGGRGGRGGFGGGGYGGYSDGGYGGGYGGGGYGGGYSGYDQYGQGSWGGYGGGGYGSYDQSGGAGYGSYDQTSYGSYSGSYDQSGAWNQAGYAQDQGGYKMKASRGRGGQGYQPY